MMFNFFKKKKINRDYKADEKQLLITEIGEDKINRFCCNNLIKKDSLSIYILNLFKNNSTLLETLNNIDTKILEKINNNSLTLEDIPLQNLDLINLDIFSNFEKQRVNILRKKLVIKNNNYSIVNSNNFINEISTIENKKTICSYIDNVDLSIIKHILPIENNFITNYNNSNYTFILPNVKNKYQEKTTILFDKDTIIVTSYNNFLELSKDNLEKIENYTFILKEDLDKINNLNLPINNDEINNDNYLIDYERLKTNHLLYLIEKSNICDNDKKYYSYYFKKYYFESKKTYIFNQRFNLIDKFINDVGIDYITKISNDFNNLNELDKNKAIEEEKMTLDIFLKDIENIDNVLAIDIIKNINEFSYEQREYFLKDSKIRNKLKISLLEESIKAQYSYYSEMLKYLTVKEVLELYNINYLKEYFKNNKNMKLYKLFACLCGKDINEIVNYALNDEEFFDTFCENINQYSLVFNNIDYDLLKKIVFRIEKHNLNYSLDFVSCCTKENLYMLLKEDIKDETIIKILPELPNEVIDDFFQNNIRAKFLYKQFNIPSLVKKGVVFSTEILNSKDFFDLLKSSSLVEFRVNINAIEQKNNPIFIEKRINEYYEELLSRYNKDTKMFKDYDAILEGYNFRNKFNETDFILSGNIFKELIELIKYNPENKEEIVEILKEETSKKLTDIIIDALFKDNVYNVYLNINEMIRYNENLNNELKVLNKEKLEFYKLILNFDKLDNNEKLIIYDKFKNQNYNLIFYNDLRKIKDLSYDRIKKDMLQINEQSNYLDEENTKKYGVEVYDLREKEYILLVRKQSQYRKKSHYIRNCYSLISNENNQVYEGNFESFTFLYGYNSFDNDSLLHILETDSYSFSEKENSSRFVNRIMTAKEIVNVDNCYSEIQILNKKDDKKNDEYFAKKPDYIIVFDNITNDVLKESKRLNIPIVIITKKILDKEDRINITLNKDLDIYVSDIKYEQIKRKTR